jgi:hypothetical protein
MIVMEIMEACHRVVALVLVFLFLVPVSVQARSNGQGAACNDATATLCNYECPESVKAWMVPWAKLKDNGRFGPCCPPGMDLVAPPTRNNAYRIHLQGVGGTTNRKPTLTFKPCEIIEITVFVDKPGMKYLGLLMYAENDDGKKVGFFPVPSGVSGGASAFHTCHNGAAIIHSDANMKNYHEKIRWQAPVIGSGSLTLRVLVKHGITQGGAFYWPGTFSYNGNTARVNLTEDLVLSEDGYNKDDSKQRWFVSHKGETCNAACARMSIGSECDENAMLDLATKGTSPEVQYAPANKFYTCRLPFLQKPSTSGGQCMATSTFTVDPDDGWCYWKKPTGQCPILSECSTKSNEDGRLCACNNTNVDYTKECPSPLFNGFTSVNISAEEIDAIVVDVPIEDESSDISNGTEQGGPPKQNKIVDEEKKGSDDFSNDIEEASKSDTGLVVGVIVCLVIVAGVLAAVVYRHWRKKKDAAALYLNFKKKKIVGSSSNGDNSNVAVAITVDEFRQNPIVLEMAEMATGLPTNSINKRVDTIFGAGTVIEKRDYGSHVIQLDWKLAGGSVAYMYQGQQKNQKEARPSVALAPPPSRGKKRGPRNKLHTTPLTICFVFISVLAQGPRCCNAHNWLHNPSSRASKTSTTTPCPPAELSRPAHMQVGPNQEFEVEFMSGHSSTYTYFAIIRHEDEKKLLFHGQNMFERYIAAAPEGATVPAPERTHVGCGKLGQYGGWQKELTAEDPEYIRRPGAFFRKYCTGALKQFKYTKALRAKDVFTSYHSDKYPWLEGVYRFKHGQSFPDEWDTVRLKIPANKGAGRHILHYVWRGYRDCVDVNVLAPGEVAADKWGKEGLKRWRRIDHCQFESYMGNPPNIQAARNRPARTKCWSADKPAGVKVCLNACTSKGSLHKTRDWSCSGVNVVPVINPPTTATMFHNFSICDNIPKELTPEELATCMAFEPNHGRGKCLKAAETRAQAAWLACRKSVVNIPWLDSLGSSVVDMEKASKTPISSGVCVESQFKPWAKRYAKQGKVALVCYGVQTYLPPRQARQNVGEIWRTTTDPSDPVFYSSCYIYGPQARKFKGVTCGKACELKDSDISSTEWKFGDQCVACDLAKKKFGVWDTPKWLISKECQNCEEKWSEI